MAVVETLQGLGSWGFRLTTDTPKSLLDALQYFGHVTIHTNKVPVQAGDALLRSARYTGVYRGKGSAQTDYVLKGAGMAWWLGDEEDKGEVYEAPLTIPTGTTFNAAVPLLLPGSLSVIAGTIFSPAKTFDGTFQYTTPRRALDYLCQTVGGCGWRVNGDGTLDAGLESDLWVTVPKTAVLRRKRGTDLFTKGFDGLMATDQDMEDFTTRVVLLASGSESATVTATADINPVLNPFLNLRGNPVELTRIISESETDPVNAPARAQLQLNRFTGPRNAITLSTEEYDIKGDVAVGDYLWVYDPDIGVYDLLNEIDFFGERLYPMKLRLTELNWPVSAGMGVAFRAGDGTWYDLSPYVYYETGSTNVTVGGYNRSLGGDGGGVGSRPIADTSIPDAPTWVTPFINSVYQADDGTTYAQVQLKWVQPLNQDGSAILDGDHYEIRYRSSSTPIFPSTHAQMAARTHTQLSAGTHEQPIAYVPGPYQIVYVPFTELTTLLQGLPTNMPYEAQIRAVDAAKPPNAGTWSSVTVFQTSGDTLPPATPAPPVIAASTMAIQVVHSLGRSDGGTFNLDPDLHHLEVHGEYEPLFTPSDTTLLGKLSATNGMMLSRTDAVGTLPIDSLFPVYFKVVAVDNDGNASPASSAVQTTALLVDDAHISSLTVSKITAGTISADWLVGATIMSGTPGAGRVQLVPTGLEAYNPANVKTVDVNIDGTISITGRFQTGASGQRIVIDPSFNTGSATRAVIQMYDDTTTNYVEAKVYGGNFLLAARKQSDGTLNGGQIFFDLVNDGSGSAYLEFQNASVDWFHQVGSDGGHGIKGFFKKTSTFGGVGALYIDQVGGSGTNASITYGVTYATTPIPFVDVQPTSGGAAGKYHCISSRSATGFNIEYPAGNYDLFIWSVRYG